MTNDVQPQSPPTPAEEARQDWAAAGRRRPLVTYAIVAVLALVLGAGAMFAALRFWPGGGPSVPGGSAASATHLGHEGQPAAPGEPPSDKAVFVSPARQQLIGVRTAEVTQQALETTIRTVGVLAYDETRVVEIHPKISGWVESVSVDFVGKAVRRGQPLFSVYSPDLVATQKEYLLALKAQAQLGASRFAETRAGAGSLLAATRERLRLWDITDAQIAELERTGEPRKSLTLYSPFDGTVLERNAFPGQYVTPEMSTFKIADLSTIWVLGQIFEYELPLVKLGQQAEIQFPYTRAGRPLTGRIAFVYPEVDPMTRRIKVRIELANPGFAFKPESYVTVLVRTGAGRQLAVPKEAVIDNGDKRYAILALADGYFEPRTIEVGEPVDAFYPVLAGLQRGDRVVTSAQFLIDSETNLQAAMQAMAGMPGMETAALAPGPAGVGREGGATPAQTPAPQSSPAARLDIVFRSQPNPPEVGSNTFEVLVKDAEGRAVMDADVRIAIFMPAMPSMGMPAMRSSAAPSHVADGTYRGTGQVPMAGTWQVTVTVSRNGQPLGTRRLTIVVR
jgi:RND family efflux transporter MFP subunit